MLCNMGFPQARAIAAASAAAPAAAPPPLQEPLLNGTAECINDAAAVTAGGLLLLDADRSSRTLFIWQLHASLHSSLWMRICWMRIYLHIQ